MVRHLLLSCLFVLILGWVARADTLKLKDGTALEGTVIDQGTQYWIKGANGESQLIDKDRVDSWVRSSSSASSLPKSAAPSAHPAPPGSSRSFAAVKAQADLVDTPIAAVGLWQAFIDSKPNAKDLQAATVELKHWQQMLDGFAEKINGKWVWGEDRKKLIKHVRELIQQGDEALVGNQTLTAIAKFEEAVKIYPNNFEANFALGYFNLVQGTEAGHNSAKIDTGIRLLENASKLRPDSAAPLSDLAIAYNFRGRYELSVLTAYQAAKIQDSKEIVQNLVNSIAQVPPGMRQNNSKIRSIMQEAGLLASKYGISDGHQEWAWVHPEDKKAPGSPAGGEDEDESKGPPGIFANGSGFLITADGYIVTNRHVAKPGDYLMVRLADGTEKLAERIVIDDEQDLAVIKIKTNTDLPFVRLASYDHPATGANVYVFGFPLLGQFGLNSNVKMTRGGVSAWDKDQEYCDVTVDAQVNPGNSGGPMVDSHGNLLAITAMKTLAVDSTVSSYGLGLSTGRIRTFFDKQKAKLTGAPVTPGKEDGPDLSGEEIAKRLTPATVCVFCCRGTPPAAGQRVEKPDTDAP